MIIKNNERRPKVYFYLDLVKKIHKKYNSCTCEIFPCMVILERTKYMELNLKNDIVFKALFAKKGNEKYLKSFLQALLNEKVDKIEILGEVSLLQMKKTEKLGRLDIKATINESKIVNIEIQLKDRKDMEQRTEVYGAKLITEQLGKGDEYTNLKPVILINILDYEMLDVPEYCTKTVTVADKHRDYEVVKDVTYWFIELPKFRKSKPKLANLLECWLALIDSRDRGLIKMAEEKDEIIKEASEEVEEILSDEEVKALNEYLLTASWEEKSRIYNAKLEGEEEGKRQEKIEIAKKMLKMGMSIEQISQATELTEKEINQL